MKNIAHPATLLKSAIQYLFKYGPLQLFLKVKVIVCDQLRSIRNNKDINLSTEDLILKYREFTKYNPDVVVFEKTKIHIDKKLPSEPPEGITYVFSPTGYFTKGKNIDYCVIHTPWRNINNYCHWTLSEIPLILLSFQSVSKNIVIPDELLNVQLPYQIRWWETIKKNFPDKNIIALSQFPVDISGVKPVNHDTSISNKPIGKTTYRAYHHGRATPYAIELFNNFKHKFLINNKISHIKVYIKRTTRTLENEKIVQEYLKKQGFDIIILEDYPLDEQIQIFSNADFIIGFHGTGLSNLVYSNSNQKVIEIVDIDCVYPSYRDGLMIPGKKATRTYFHMVAHMKNLRYEVIESKNYTLNIDKLDKLYHKMQE